MSCTEKIVLRGVRVHNLKGIDVDIPKKRLVVLCGPSGSGKTSLAVDTVYNEGHRRYLESFSAHARQFLDNLPRADADLVEGISPAVAVTAWPSAKSQRATVATATEIYDYLRLLFAALGRVYCVRCGRPVVQHTPRTILRELESLPDGTRMMVAFPSSRQSDETDWQEVLSRLLAEGFTRIILGDRSYDLEAAAVDALALAAARGGVLVLLDRVIWGRTDRLRVMESLEAALRSGGGTCVVLVQASGEQAAPSFGARNGRATAPAPQDAVAAAAAWPGQDSRCESSEGTGEPALPRVLVDGVAYRRMTFRDHWRCAECGIDYLPPEPKLFNFNSSHGACSCCEGFGTVMDIDLDRVIPDREKSLSEGAVTIWEGRGRGGRRPPLLQLAADSGIPTDVPISRLSEEQFRTLVEGDAEAGFPGIRGWLREAERQRRRTNPSGPPARYRTQRVCPECGGGRLRREALAVRLQIAADPVAAEKQAGEVGHPPGGAPPAPNIAELCRWSAARVLACLRPLNELPEAEPVGESVLRQLLGRLEYLEQVGLGYLTLDRPVSTLSGGELRRVLLAGALGSSLVNMVYVLDEPSTGLHARDISKLVQAVVALRDRGNTVLVVEHEEAFVCGADHVIELGPGAGDRGGQIVYQGTPGGLMEAATLTADHLTKRRGLREPPPRRRSADGWIRLCGAKGNNLKDLTVEFPLGVLCAVAGVSGAGKSSLVRQTLYPALCHRLGKGCDPPLPYADLLGEGQIGDAVLVEPSAPGHTARSCVATYLKIWDEIRRVFAETVDARTRGMGPRHFSFNADEGACEECGGEGYLDIDMQFLADVRVTCPRCQGRRFREEILEVFHRGKNPADVLEMTVREAFAFFRGYPKVQAKLKRLIEVGLDYLRLGQAARTLSGGEAQRLRLASHLSTGRRGRSLFVLEEPSTGLHDADVTQLLDNFESLLDVGHSLIVIEHHLGILAAADYIIELGPEAGDGGGRVVAAGTPEEIVRCPASVTGHYLAPVLGIESRRGTSRKSK